MEISGTAKVIGTDTGIEVRAGSVTISGGEISTTSKTFSAAANGGGTSMSGVAVALSQHTTDLPTTITIKGDAKISASGDAYAVYEADLQNYTGTKTLDIQGGTISGKISSENCTDFISGGTFSDLTSALTYSTGQKASIKLSGDVSVEGLSISGKRNLTVDLNGKTVSVTGTKSAIVDVDPLTGSASTSNYGAVTFSNGNIQFTAKPGAYFALSCEQGALTLNKVNLTTPGWDAALRGQGEKAKLVVKNQSEITGKYFGLCTNAELNKTGAFVYGRDAVIELSNSTFNGPESGILNNVPANITVENCTIKGDHQGILLRGGTCTFKGTNTLELTATYSGSKGSNSTDECRNTSSWSSANQAAFAPLVIGNRGGGYAYPSKVTFAEGSTTTVKTSGTYAANYPGVYVWANAESGNGVTITGISNVTIDKSIQVTPAIQYGSSNITVDGATQAITTITTPGE
jgi:hypothetical protein